MSQNQFNSKDRLWVNELHETLRKISVFPYVLIKYGVQQEVHIPLMRIKGHFIPWLTLHGGTSDGTWAVIYTHNYIQESP